MSVFGEETLAIYKPYEDATAIRSIVLPNSRSKLIVWPSLERNRVRQISNDELPVYIAYTFIWNLQVQINRGQKGTKDN